MQELSVRDRTAHLEQRIVEGARNWFYSRQATRAAETIAETEAHLRDTARAEDALADAIAELEQ